MLLGDLPERGEFVNSGVDRQHVEMSRLVLDRRIDMVEVGKVGGVALNRGGFAADRGDGLFQFGLAASGDKHTRALFGEALGDTEADPGAAAGHERDFA
jgi:hypothetical protein